MQELRDILKNKSSCHEYGQSDYKDGLKVSLTTAITFIDFFIEKEKEDLMKAFSDGQETPINHPTLPHYSREEYYNDNYNQN